ncbi:MAG TPA: amino acid permease [Longimicrobiales bacterium]
MTPPLPEPQGSGTVPARSLLRILGVLFGWAVTVGSMIGAGILRAPGDVAQATTSVAVFLGLWLAGALYALLGALSLAELGAMIPESGGQTVFVRRAFGDYPGFVVGWSDWISTCAAVAAIAIVLAESLGAVVPGLLDAKALVASLTVLLLMAAHWRGVRTSGRVQTVTSALKALAFAALILACFRAGGTSAAAPRVAPAVGLIVALQAVIYTYDGWAAALYFSGEVRNPGREIPRSMLLGLLSVMVIYLLVNVAFLAVLGLDGMAGSVLVADDVARNVFGAGGTSIIRTLIAVSLLSAVSANLLLGTRVIYSLGRLQRFGVMHFVNVGGTPTAALALSAGIAVAFALTGAFERVIAVAAFFFVANYAASFLAVFWLRRKEPDTPRPYRAFGHPFSTGTALLISLAFLASAALTDPRHSAVAVVLLLLSYPVYRWLKRAT